MATAKRKGVGMLVLVVLLAGALAWWIYGEEARAFGDAGTGYGAKNACSCRFLAGHDLDSCYADFVPGMETIFLSQDEEERSVTAYIPLVASRTARYREGYGCVLDPE